MKPTFTIYHKKEEHPFSQFPDIHQDTFSKVVLGFWIYLMTDCLLFSALFATYAVLHNNTFGGPSSHELYDLPTAFIETGILLISSLTSGLALLASLSKNRVALLGWLIATFLLGASFVGIELHEFAHLVEEGHSWTKSAFLSSFFALVGTHGLHVSCGLLWLLVLIGQLFYAGGKIGVDIFRRLVVFSLFWHFLDLVWIFIFTFVYLLGVL